MKSSGPNFSLALLDTDQPDLAFKALSKIFPDAEPKYLEDCISHYQFNIVARVCEKITLFNAGYYPKLPTSLLSLVHTSSWDSEDTQVEWKNHQLTILADCFPYIDIDYLKQKILKYPTNTVYEVAQKFLKNPQVLPLRPKFGVLEQSQLFKSPSYIQASLARLNNEFPVFWKSSIKAHFAEHNYDFLQTYRHLRLLPNPPTLFFPFSWFKRKPHFQLPTHPLLESQCQVLEKEERDAMEWSDHTLALQLNQKEYEDHHQLFECNCCFDFIAFESILTCENTHIFCIQCVIQMIREAVFGQQKSLLTMYGLKCCHATGCTAVFHVTSLQRLETMEPNLMFHYWQQMTLLQLDPNVVLQCLFCGYLEWIPTPSPSGSTFSFYLSSKSMYVYLLVTTMLTTFHWFTGFLSCLFLMCLGWFFHRHHHPRRRRFDRPDQFVCQACKKTSCLLCRSEYLPHHQCFDIHSLGLIPYVETAMTNAVKRVCPNCSLCFTKADGCNLIKCANCRYVMCYLCRKDIRVENYDHFCRHFRMTPGRPCTQCQKCDLYLSENEHLASQRAGRSAYHEWKRAHPHVPIEPKVKRELKKLIDI
ncbi:hypothetical protein HMI54_008470 [Coelomomyces lativittatus]|nr:hypothetical protein HMI54_008470 [Coelomomyces lativittatus]KAJ1505499.1 hypothetical protein HMI55_001569 [Coelomomyces lativittatus]KAJ1510208.1 hypothetical protein HMI56_006448 [Coelomomyces lativittatus]